MTAPKLTEWYSAKEFHPTVIGWYDYRGLGIGEIRAFWDGKGWGWKPKGHPFQGMFICRSDEWRGLARKPK